MISVVVCTRNRSVRLLEGCGALLAASSAVDWELLIVDNSSTDDTFVVAAGLAERHPGRVRVALERSLGLSAARNRGILLARGERIAFLDDDAVADAGWLESMAGALESDDIWAVGGPVAPIFESPPPPWFLPEYLPYVSAWDRGANRHELEYNEFPRGANMAFRREAFAQVGGFDPRLGRRGRSLRSCEEIELCLRIARAGRRVVYEPDARVRHHVAGDRLTERWLVDRFGAQGRSEAILEWKHFGAAGLREGLLRGRRTVASRLAAGERSALAVRCARAAHRAYALGAVYAVLAVPRWAPPAAAATSQR